MYMFYYSIYQLLQSYIQTNMKKQISFEQNSSTSFLINIKNIFGFSINYVEDQIKKHQGKWDRKTRKFQVPLAQMSNLTKQLHQIDKTFSIQQVYPLVTQMSSKYAQSDNKVKKQILIDNNLVRRYTYIQESIIRNILQNCKNSNKALNYNKILIICPQSKLLTWSESLKKYRVRKIIFDIKQPDICQAQDYIWQCSYQLLWQKTQLLNRYCFQTIIIDQAQILSNKLSKSQQPAGVFLKFLLKRYFIFPVVSKLWLNKLQLLTPLLSIMLPQTNFSWFAKRYQRKQNISELSYLLKHCGLVRDLNNNNSKQSNSLRQKFNKLTLQISQVTVQKIKTLNKKSTQIEQKKLLQNPQLARNKYQKQYIQSMYELFRQQKMEYILKNISYYSIQLNIKLAIIIQTNSVYRSIQNYLCEKQITYCHYEHHQEVIQFNKNPETMVCLIKSEYLSNVNFTRHVILNEQIANSKLESHLPEQYLCLSGVKTVFFPDVDWFFQTKKKEESIRGLFRYVHGDLIRFYFILKGTYEEKWVKSMQQFIVKVQMNIKLKQDLQEEEQNQLQGIQGASEPCFAFCDINLAKVQQQYENTKMIKGITDIDQEFDRLEYQALQQRQIRQSKKKIKEQKAKQKQKQKQVQLSSQQKLQRKGFKTENLELQANFKHSQSVNKQVGQFLLSADSEQQFEIYSKKQNQPSKKKNQQQNQILLPIYFVNNSNKDTSSSNIQSNTTKQINKTQIKDDLSKDVIVDIRKNSLQIEKGPQKLKVGQYRFMKQQQKDYLKQDQTQQVQIIQVRKPKSKSKKSKSGTLRVILQPYNSSSLSS